MAVTAKWYGQALTGQYGTTAARRVNWTGDTINVALCTATYTPNQDTHVFFSDITGEVANGNGYTSGGQALAGKSVSYDATTNETRLIASTASSWTSATFTARYAIVYSAAGGTAATNPLLGYVDFGGDEAVSSGTFTITWDTTNGVLKLAAA